MHRFYDRTAKIELGVAIAADAFDSAQTCHGLANGTHEYGLPTQHCAPATLLLAAQVAGQELVAYSFHRLGWHKPEKFVRLFSIQENVRGIVNSKRMGGW